MSIRNTIALPVALLAAGALVVGIQQGSPPASAAAASAWTGDVVSNGRTWHQAYQEDFTTPAALGSVLRQYPAIAAYNGQRDTSGRGLYAPDRVLSVSQGVLDFWLHTENGQPLVATILPAGYSSATTGRVSVRYRTSVTQGYKFVGMLWPSDDDWNKGEIDWPEGDLGGTVRPASGIPGTLGAAGLTFDRSVMVNAPSPQSEYHTATTEWDRGIVRFYQDDTLVASTTRAVPTTPMRVTLQAETAITGPVPATSSGHVHIDWIKIWR